MLITWIPISCCSYVVFAHVHHLTGNLVQQGEVILRLIYDLPKACPASAARIGVRSLQDRRISTAAMDGLHWHAAQSKLASEGFDSAKTCFLSSS